jgi:hypothetical protein
MGSRVGATMTLTRTLLAGGVLLVVGSLLAHARLDRYSGFGWLEEVGVVIGSLAIVAGLCLRLGRSR